MPKMGESIMEGTILKWLKKPGDTIEQDESVLEVATDKVDTEIPAPEAGILKEILAKEGDVVQVGKPIAIISTDSDKIEAGVETTIVEQVMRDPDTVVPPYGAGEGQVSRDVSPPQPPVPDVSTDGHWKLEKPVAGRFYSPLVLNIVRQEKIPMEELEYVPGLGKAGRVTKKDILSYVENRTAVSSEHIGAGVETTTATGTVAQEAVIEKSEQTAAAPSPIQPPLSTPPAVSISGKDEIIEMDRIRKMIADRMVDSKRISPHVTSFVEADVSNIVMWRNKIKAEFLRKKKAKSSLLRLSL